MKPTKNTFIYKFISGALLLAGLFYFLKEKTLRPREITKPSQLTFSDSNKLPEKTDSFKNTAKTVQETSPNSPNEKKAETDFMALLPENEKKIWSIFESVLNSKNDNDSRVNNELKNLSSGIHAALYEKYEAVSAENRNGRGLIVFLIARDLKSKEDFDFVTKVYQEPPCLSLEDCKNVGSDDAHHSGLNQTTLIYPQLVGLYQIEQQVETRPEILKDPIFRNKIISLLSQAEDFPVPAVQQKAQELRRKFGL